MPVSKSSRISRPSKNVFSTILCFFAAAGILAAAITFIQRTGATLYFGDAEAHLDIARRIVDSLTPGWSQVGTTWLPLPHLLMLLLVRNDWLWRTGLAGAITSGLSMTLAVTFLFAAVRRIFADTTAAAAAALVFLLNPNTLYMGSIPMSEAVFLASLFALLYFTVRFRETRGWGAVLGASLAALCGTLTRYEAWFLLPFVALYLVISARRKRIAALIIFCLIAALGPALWLAHNRWYYGDPLYFYRGPYSAMALQGTRPYPGRGDWRLAAQYFLMAGEAVAGWPALFLLGAGTLLAFARRVVWPVLLLALPPVFYVWAIHSSGVPIFVPALWPHTFYNTRYGLAFLPLVALGAAALVRQFPRPLPKPLFALGIVGVALSPFLIHPFTPPVTWQESEINSRVRRAWIAQTAAYLSEAAGPNQTFLTGFGELTPIYRTLGVPLRNTLTGDNDLEWNAAMARPDLFLQTDWAVVESGDDMQTMIDRARLHGPRYELQRRVTVKGAPVIEIYKRTYEDPLR
jgi:Dolichyl-phosphate-mannose-protein mannosyltransferase